MDNEEILSQFEEVVKAFIGTSSGGQLAAEQLDTFIDTVVDQSKFLKSGVTTYTGIEASAFEMHTIGLDSRVMRKAAEGTAGGTQGITIVKRQLNPVEVSIDFDITDKFLKRNIAKGNADAQIQALFVKMYMNDLVDLAFNGDATGQAGVDFVNITDGYIVKALADGDVHKPTFGAGDDMLTVLAGMRDSLPNQWLEDTTMLKFYMSPQKMNLYRDQLKAKNTPLGDAMTVGGQKPAFDGIEIEVVGKLGNTDLFLTRPENFAVGIGQDMKVEWMRQPRKRLIEYTVTGYVDVNYVISDALVYARIV